MTNQKKPKTNKYKNGLAKYWFIVVPAIIMNAAFLLDNVIATNTENAFAERMSEIVNSQDQEDSRKTIRSHWVQPNADGSIDGRISAIDLNATVPIENLTVSLIQSGEKVYQAVTDSQGQFRVENVNSGIYTLIAAGKNGFMAYGVQILPKFDNNNLLEGLNTEVERKEAVRAYYVSHFNLPKDAVIQDGLQIDAAAVPPKFNTLQRITQTYLSGAGTPMGVDAKGVGKATDIAGGFKHPLTPEGSFKGRIQPIASESGEKSPMADMNIFLIQDDQEKGRVPVEENGEFEIKDVSPGAYAVVCAGKDGFAAISLELVSATGDAQSSNNKNSIHYVSTKKQGEVPPIGIAIVTDPADLQLIQDEVDNVVQMQQPFDPNMGDIVGNEVPMFDSGFPVSSSGFPGGPGLSASGPGGFPSGPSPTSFAPTNSGPSSFSPQGRSGRRGLRALIIAAAISIPLALNDSRGEPMLPVSNSQPNLN